jgi:hypothetical protein
MTAQLESPELLPPEQQPKKRHTARWIVASAATGLVVLLVGIGIGANGGHTTATHSAPPSTSQPATTQPTTPPATQPAAPPSQTQQILDWYTNGGSDQITGFATDLTTTSTDAQYAAATGDTSSLTADGSTLISDANTALADPPPASAFAKHYLKAVHQIKMAGEDIVAGNYASATQHLMSGTNQTNKAAAVLQGLIGQ